LTYATSERASRRQRRRASRVQERAEGDRAVDTGQGQDGGLAVGAQQAEQPRRDEEDEQDEDETQQSPALQDRADGGGEHHPPRHRQVDPVDSPQPAEVAGHASAGDGEGHETATAATAGRSRSIGTTRSSSRFQAVTPFSLSTLNSHSPDGPQA
jgi:hypothetical protein